MNKYIVLFCALMTGGLCAGDTYYDGYNNYSIGSDGVAWVYDYEYDSEAGHSYLVLYGCTNMPVSGVLQIPQTLETYMGEETIVKIAEEAFNRSKRLVSVSIPATIEEIGSDAFRDCVNLTTVSFSGGNGTQILGDAVFFGCKSLSSITLPNSVEYIGDLAFYKCTGIGLMTLPKALESIGDKAFLSCSNLYVTSMPSGIQSIGSSAFEGTAMKKLDLPQDLKSLGGRSFAFCEHLTDVVIRSPSVTIGICEFYSCINLKKVALADGIKEIQTGAFSGDVRLTEVEWPSTLESIDEDAFRNCDLQRVVLPKSLKTVGSSAFFGNKNINSLCILSSDLSVGVAAFEPVETVELGNEFVNFELLQGLDALIRGEYILVWPGKKAIPDSAFQSVWCDYIYLPSSVTSIGSYAFNDCRAMDIVIAGAVTLAQSAFEGAGVRELRLETKGTSIPNRAFAGSSLTNLVLSSSVQEIGDEAFCDCIALQNLSWPKQLRVIGDSAFAGCEALTNLNLEATQVAEIGENAFSFCIGLLDPVNMPTTLAKIGDRAFYGATIWPNAGAKSSFSRKDSTINFLGLPPADVGDNAFAETYDYGYGLGVFNSIYLATFDKKYAEQWKKAIEDWSDENDTEGKWYWLEFVPEIVVEPIAWELNTPTSGDQSLTIGWHIPTNEVYTMEQALKDLPEKNCQFAIWRSMPNPQALEDATNFAKAVCIKQNCTQTNYIDTTFGKVSGTLPVNYWVEVQLEKNASGIAASRERPNKEPASRLTRRRFALSVGLSAFSPGMTSEEPHAHAAEEAIEFSSIMRSTEGAVVVQRINADAKHETIVKDVVNFRNKVQPGDEVFFFMSSHGSPAGSQSVAAISAYDNHFSAKDIYTLFFGSLSAYGVSANAQNAFLPSSGVKLTVVFNACYSGGLVPSSVPVNTLWVACARHNQAGNCDRAYSQFGRTFITWGLSEGYADARNLYGLDGCICTASGDGDGHISVYEAYKYADFFVRGKMDNDPQNVLFRGDYGLARSTEFVGKSSFLRVEQAVTPRVHIEENGTVVDIIRHGTRDGELLVSFTRAPYTPLSSLHWLLAYLGTSDGSAIHIPSVNNTQPVFSDYVKIDPNTTYSISVQALNQMGYSLPRWENFQTDDLTSMLESIIDWLADEKAQITACFTMHNMENCCSYEINDETTGSSIVGTATVAENGDVQIDLSGAVLTYRYGKLYGTCFGRSVQGCSVVKDMTWGSENAVLARFGEYFEYSVDAELVAMQYSAENLPEGLSIDVDSGVIFGTPTVSGSYLVMVSITSREDAGRVGTFKLLVEVLNSVVEAKIVKEGIAEGVNEDGISFGVDADVQFDGTYELVLSLATTNGTSLGQYSESQSCVVGRNHFVVTVPVDAVRTYAENGPYVVTKAVLMCAEEIICEASDLYTTEMEDFAAYFGFEPDEPDEPDDPDAPLSQTIGGYTWYYSVVGEGAVIQKIVDYGFISWGECAVEPTPTGDIELPSVLGGKKVVGLGESALEDCDELTSVVIGSSVTNIGESAFYGCSSLTNMTFEGDAPTAGHYAFTSVDYGCTVTVYGDSVGWDEDEDGYWNDMEIIYRERETPSDGPSVSDDPGATVVGDATSGYTITPSASKTDVEVMIPSGVAADKVTVEIGTDVVRIKPNGATVKIKKGTNDITSYLVLPVADLNGTIDLTKVAVKTEIVQETLDPNKGAVILLNATSPTITTTETKPGLTYTLKEGTTIKGMDSGDSKVGDGKAWTPNITVKGGTSGFYSIGVTK